ncbi:MAG: TIGR03067 domain-containing protein [Pirellulales bacterium]
MLYLNQSCWSVCLLLVLGQLTGVAGAAEEGAPKPAAEKPADSSDAAKKLTPEQLVGDWEYVLVEKGGEKREAKDFQNQAVKIEKETFTLAGEGKFVMKYTLDNASDPTRIKLTITESPFGTGAETEGIIRLEGDQLKLCYAAMGEKAPQEFASPTGSGARLLVLKRKPAKP